MKRMMMMIVKSVKQYFIVQDRQNTVWPEMGNVVDEEVSAAFCNSAVCKRYIVAS